MISQPAFPAALYAASSSAPKASFSPFIIKLISVYLRKSAAMLFIRVSSAKIRGKSCLLCRSFLFLVRGRSPRFLKLLVVHRHILLQLGYLNRKAAQRSSKGPLERNFYSVLRAVICVIHLRRIAP